MLQRVRSVQQTISKPLANMTQHVSKAFVATKKSVGGEDARKASGGAKEGGSNGASSGAVEMAPVDGAPAAAGAAIAEQCNNGQMTVFSDTVEDVPMAQPSGETHHSSLPFTPVTLAFKDVRYCVPLVKKEKEEVTKDPAAMLELLKVGGPVFCWVFLWWVCMHDLMASSNRASPESSAPVC